MDWSVNPKERLSEACLTFLNISPESEVVPTLQGLPCACGSHFQGASKQPLYEELGYELPGFQAPFCMWTQSQVQ